ncbi:hypothetical protein ACOTV2_11980, partial [Aliarcobacter butzleri]
NHYDSGKWYECERCGKFFAEDTIYIDLETKDLSHTFSSYLKESSESKEYVRLLNEDDLDKCLNIPDKQIKSKYDLFLKYIK